jgi:hypothetical protein
MVAEPAPPIVPDGMGIAADADLEMPSFLERRQIHNYKSRVSRLCNIKAEKLAENGGEGGMSTPFESPPKQRNQLIPRSANVAAPRQLLVSP